MSTCDNALSMKINNSVKIVAYKLHIYAFYYRDCFAAIFNIFHY